MEISLLRGGHGGTLAVGGTRAIIVAVEADADQMTVEAVAEGGRLILRLARDGETFSGNWVLGSQRGTVAARRLPGSPNRGYPSPSTGRSSRPPHSAHEPS